MLLILKASDEKDEDSAMKRRISWSLASTARVEGEMGEEFVSGRAAREAVMDERTASTSAECVEEGRGTSGGRSG
jgi:hypothetical protein